MPLIRYPGSKAKLREAIIEDFPDGMVSQSLFVSPGGVYVEPFVGSGAVAFEVMEFMHRNSSVILADIDPGIAALWTAVRDEPNAMHGRIMTFKPSVEAFFQAKENDGTAGDCVEVGFRKLVLHRLSVSGFGYMAGGPIGGKKQTGEYNVDCRWNPERMCNDVTRLNKLMRRVDRCDIRNCSAIELLNDAAPNWFVYLDPPYYEKGSQLYKFSMEHGDHVELAEAIKQLPCKWVVSYDDHPAIRELYDGSIFRELNVRYSNAVVRQSERPKNREILISSAA